MKEMLKRTCYRVERESGEVQEQLSPSKVLAWVVTLVALVYAGMWLLGIGAAAGASETTMILVLAGLGAVSYMLFSKPGDLVDAFSDRFGSQ